MNGPLYPTRCSRIAARKLGDEMLIMSASDSTLFTLNATATILWEAADGRSSLEQIVADKICAQFEVPYAEALQDAEELARALAAHGILQLSNEPAAPPALRQAMKA